MAKRLARQQHVLLAETYYWRAAVQRREDSDILLTSERTTGAVYLAGYAAECAVKCWLLARTPRNQKALTLERLRGRFGHDLELLREAAVGISGEATPRQINEDFVIVTSWNTDLRYFSGPIPLREATFFVEAVDRILDFIKGRL